MRNLLWTLLLAASVVGTEAAAGGLELNRTLFTSLLLLFIIFIVVYFYWRLHLPFPSESAIAMAVGLGVAGIARAAGAYHSGEAFDFNETFFSTVILPTVMLNFGYNSRTQILRLNALPIFIYIFGALVLNFAFFAITFYAIQNCCAGSDWPAFGDDTRLLVSTLFTATIVSAVEPDAILAYFFETYNMDHLVPQPVIYGILLWESIISSSTMFDSAEVLLYIGLYDQHLDWGQALGRWAWKLVVAVILGLLVGLLFALVHTLLTKYLLDMRTVLYQYQEVGLALVMPYFCYWCCQYINFAQTEVRISSPIAICATGVVMSNLTWGNWSEGARYYYQVVIGALAHLAEMYNYAILGSTLFYVVDNGKWVWGYALTILGLMFAARLFVIPLIAILRPLFLSPTSYFINYPPFAHEPLTEDEKVELARVFNNFSGGSTELSVEQTQEILAMYGHPQTYGKTKGLMTIVDEGDIESLTLFEFYSLMERTGWHRANWKEPASDKFWTAKTALIGYMAGVRGHIAFGTAFLGMNSTFVAYLAGTSSATRAASDDTASADTGILAPLLATTWAIVAIGNLVQGALSPLLLNLLKAVPHGHEPDENVHRRYRHPGIWGFLMRNTKVSPRHVFTSHCSHQVRNADEDLLEKETNVQQEERMELEKAAAVDNLYMNPYTSYPVGGYPLIFMGDSNGSGYSNGNGNGYSNGNGNVYSNGNGNGYSNGNGYNNGYNNGSIDLLGAPYYTTPVSSLSPVSAYTPVPYAYH
jgi:hypothetical protein